MPAPEKKLATYVKTQTQFGSGRVKVRLRDNLDKISKTVARKVSGYLGQLAENNEIQFLMPGSRRVQRVGGTVHTYHLPEGVRKFKPGVAQDVPMRFALSLLSPDRIGVLFDEVVEEDVPAETLTIPDNTPSKPDRKKK